MKIGEKKMSKKNRSKELLMILQEQKYIKIKEICQKMGIKGRQVRNYKKKLLDEGYNIVSHGGSKGGYELITK